MNDWWFCGVMFETVWNRWGSHGIFFGPLPSTFHVLAYIILVKPENDSLGWTGTRWEKCQTNFKITDETGHDENNIKVNLAISGTSGSSGLGSQSSEQIESRTWGGQNAFYFWKKAKQYIFVTRVTKCIFCRVQSAFFFFIKRQNSIFLSLVMSKSAIFWTKRISKTYRDAMKIEYIAPDMSKHT